MSDLLIKNGRVIDPANGVDGQFDLLIEKGKISAVKKSISDGSRKIIDAKGKWVAPGLVDIHTHFREPGYEYKETIETGARAAAVGGFTSVACMANTNPVNDCGAVTEFILDKAKSAIVNVHPIGAVTRGLKGEALADIGEMAELGVAALSDDGKCITNGSVLRAAMEYASMFGLTIMEHADDYGISQNGSMNEGSVSSELGLAGAPAIAEDIITARDISIAEYCKAPIHFCHVSTAGCAELIRRAKDRGAQVTAEAAPHHFSITDEACRGYNTNAKMAPPLRHDSDVTAIIEGLSDGTIDCIASDHAPHSLFEKQVEFDNAAFGIVGLETSLGLSMALVHNSHMTPAKLIEAMSLKPAGIIGIDRGTLTPGAVADVTIIDPDLEWTVEPSEFKSKGRNTPFAGQKLKGKAVYTIVKGKVVSKC
ncbi:Dihydroorotase [hydrothermal vent metagenome]|uniref:Dihydroorotase n=1 Tax=hydrothermal vent metagenome TaxID=652676 RepID=A0A3B1CLI6_9ZZZZ